METTVNDPITITLIITDTDSGSAGRVSTGGKEAYRQRDNAKQKEARSLSLKNEEYSIKRGRKMYDKPTIENNYLDSGPVDDNYCLARAILLGKFVDKKNGTQDQIP